MPASATSTLSCLVLSCLVYKGLEIGTQAEAIRELEVYLLTNFLKLDASSATGFIAQVDEYQF